MLSKVVGKKWVTQLEFTINTLIKKSKPKSIVQLLFHIYCLLREEDTVLVSGRQGSSVKYTNNTEREGECVEMSCNHTSRQRLELGHRSSRRRGCLVQPVKVIGGGRTGGAGWEVWQPGR